MSDKTQIAQGALRLRQEHIQLANTRATAELAFIERFDKGQPRHRAVGEKIANTLHLSGVITRRIAAGDLDRKNEAMIEATKNYEANISDAAAHKDQHLGDYIELAQADMQNQPDNSDTPASPTTK